MTRVCSMIALLIILAITLTHGHPMQTTNEIAPEVASPHQRFINLFGKQVPVSILQQQTHQVQTQASQQTHDPHQSIRIFKANMGPGTLPQNQLHADPVTSVEQISGQNRIRLFGQSYDTSAALSHSNDKASSSQRLPVWPISPASLDKDGSSQVEQPHQVSKKGKQVVAGNNPLSIEQVQGFPTKNKINAQSAAKKGKSTLRTEERSWFAHLAKKRTISKKDIRFVKKMRKLPTILEEELEQPTFIKSPHQTTEKEKNSVIIEDQGELLAQHKFRVIDQVSRKVVPFDPKQHGTYHEYGHPDNLYHYGIDADKLLKQGTINQKERHRLDYNLKKSVKVIDAMMMKKAGTAIYHQQRKIIFQNPGLEQINEETIQKQVKKALKRYDDNKLRRLIVKEDKFLSFKKPIRGRKTRTHESSSSEEDWKSTSSSGSE